MVLRSLAGLLLVEAVDVVRASGILFGKLVAAMLIASIVFPHQSGAQYYKPPESDLDPTILVIDEKKHLGAKLDGDIPLIVESGKQVPISSFLGKPLIIVFSYYTCDGSCSVINHELVSLLEDIDLVRLGDDYRILTLSFDKHDDLKTTGAFRKHVDGIEGHQDNWTFATFKNEEDLKAQTTKIGFKYFWSPQDKLFLHPGAFLFFSPEGRLIRILYPPRAGASDVELAVLDARQGQFRPQEIINFAVSLCYSYNYQEGRYTLSIPIFVGFGALFLGVFIMLASITIFKRRRYRKTLEESLDDAQTV